MAAITLEERIVIDLNAMVAAQTMTDLSDQRGNSGTQVSARTVAVAKIAAAEVQARLGDVGSYDDTDPSVGDLVALGLGNKLALLNYSQLYSLTLTQAGLDYIRSVHDQLELIARGRRQAAQHPIIVEKEDEDHDDIWRCV